MTDPSTGPLSNSNHAWVDLLPLPTVVVRDGRYVFVNEAYLKLMGLSREEALSMPLYGVVDPKDRDKVSERHGMRMRGASVPAAYELTLLRKDGERRTVEMFVSQAGHETLLQLYDLTSREPRHQNLRALARLGASLQRELSQDAIFRLLTDGLSALGAGAIRLAPRGTGLGVVGREVLARPWTSLFQRAWDEGSLFVDDVPLTLTRFLGDAAAAASLHAGAQSGALVRLDVGGARTELLLMSAPWLRAEDQPTLTLFGAQIGAALDAARTVVDLSRRNAELNALNHVATAAGFAQDLHELFERASAEMAAVTGCAAVALYLLDGPIARLTFQYGGSEEAGRLYRELPLEGTRLGEAAKLRRPCVWRLSDYDEARQQVIRRMNQEVVVSVPMMVGGRVVGVVNVAYAEAREVPTQEIELLSAMAAHLGFAIERGRLVDDLRGRNDELEHAQARLVQRERMAALGEMAAAVAHEVRNPLAVIFNLLASVRRSHSLGTSNEEVLAMLTEESERIDHLVSDLLDLARPRLPALQEVALPLLLQDSVMAVVKAEPEVQLRVEDRGLGEVAVDARLMRQVFVNLAINAVQAMSNGGTLTVRLEPVERDGVPWAQVTFEDSGHGIPDEVMPRIFEPFFTTRARGTGLGLTLVKRIVEAHRGEVRAKSSPSGAAITVAWPTGKDG